MFKIKEYYLKQKRFTQQHDIYFGHSINDIDKMSIFRQLDRIRLIRKRLDDQINIQ